MENPEHMALSVGDLCKGTLHSGRETLHSGRGIPHSGRGKSG